MDPVAQKLQPILHPSCRTEKEALAIEKEKEKKS